MTAASYSRYSTNQQREASIEDQERNADHVARSNNEVITKRYRDKEMSGDSLDRPDYQRMLADANAGLFKTLYLDDLYRLSRDDVEIKQSLRRLIFIGVRVVTFDGFDSDREGWEMDAGMRGFIGNIFLVDQRKKTHRGLTGQALKGNNAGGKSYGYNHIPIEHPTKTDHHGRPVIEAVRREINEEQAEVIRWIFERYASGHSTKKIAAQLNERNIPSPRGGTWSFSAIYGHNKKGTGILNNPLYIGQYIWNRSVWVKDPDTRRRVRRERPQNEWITTDMPELRIVSQELWERVKARQIEVGRKNKQGKSGRGTKYLFSGLLVCGVCGSRYTLVNKTKYGCAGHTNRGSFHCDNKLKVSRQIVENRLLESLRKEMLQPEAIDLFRHEVARMLTASEQPGNRAQMRKELAKVEGKIRNIMAAIEDGVWTATTKTTLEQAEGDRDNLKAALDVPKTRIKITKVIPGLVGKYKALVANLSKSIPPDEIPEAREQIKAILGEEIRLIPKETHLEAEISGGYAGILELTGAVSMVAGAGFTTYRRPEPYILSIPLK